MPIIAIINRKGGSGKSTIATHLAAFGANSGIATMLGDIDRQQSSKTWLVLRNSVQEGTRPPILTWAVDVGGSLHPPASVHWIVLDTPGGLYGLELAKVVMVADVIIMPVCNSLFDRESAAMCIEELKRLPKIRSGKCQFGVVGMRLDSRSQSVNDIAVWAKELGVNYIAHLRDVPLYVRCAEMGLTIFDLEESKYKFDRLQWAPILSWLKPYLDVAKDQSKNVRISQAGLANVPPIPASKPIWSNSPQNAKPVSPIGVLPQKQAGVPTKSPSSAMPDAKKGLFGSIPIPAFLMSKK